MEVFEKILKINELGPKNVKNARFLEKYIFPNFLNWSLSGQLRRKSYIFLSYVEFF